MSRKRSKKKGRDRSSSPTPVPPQVETVVATVVEAATAAPADPADKLPTAVPQEATEAIAAPAPAAPPSPPQPTDPPVAAELADEVAVSFFSAPPVTHPVINAEEPAPIDAATERRRRARSESGRARRRDLARYVGGAVAVCFMICAAAAVRAATVGHDETALEARDGRARPSYQAAAAPPAPVLASEPTPEPALAPAPAPAPAPAQKDPSSDPPASSPPVAAESMAQGAVDPGATPSPAPAADPIDAHEAKKLAQRALDRGDAAKAIDAAKRSIEGDATDAETWLILGGAYLQRGAYREARESFASCVHDATRGPRGECKALLH
jgi:hypothetical protein